MTIWDLFGNIEKIITNYWHIYLDGILITLQMSAIAVLVGTIAGTLISMLKMSKFRPLSFLATLYIEVIRGTPLMVQMYFFYFLVPMAFPALNTGVFFSLTMSLVLNSAAYMAEIIRSGIEAVDNGQTEAARSLGLTGRQTMLRIVIPQAVKNILPAMCNEFVSIIKETAIVATFFGGDIMTAFKTINGITYLAIEPLFVAGLCYFIITFVLSKIIALFERRLKASD